VPFSSHPYRPMHRLQSATSSMLIALSPSHHPSGQLLSSVSLMICMPLLPAQPLGTQLVAASLGPLLMQQATSCITVALGRSSNLLTFSYLHAYRPTLLCNITSTVPPSELLLPHKAAELSQTHRLKVPDTGKGLYLYLVSLSGTSRTICLSSETFLLTWEDLLRMWALPMVCTSSIHSLRRWEFLGHPTRTRLLPLRTASKAWSETFCASPCVLRKKPGCSTWTHVAHGSTQRHMTLQKLRSSVGVCNMQHSSYHKDILTSGAVTTLSVLMLLEDQMDLSNIIQESLSLQALTARERWTGGSSSSVAPTLVGPWVDLSTSSMSRPFLMQAEPLVLGLSLVLNGMPGSYTSNGSAMGAISNGQRPLGLNWPANMCLPAYGPGLTSVSGVTTSALLKDGAKVIAKIVQSMMSSNGYKLFLSVPTAQLTPNTPPVPRTQQTDPYVLTSQSLTSLAPYQPFYLGQNWNTSLLTLTPTPPSTSTDPYPLPSHPLNVLPAESLTQTTRPPCQTLPAALPLGGTSRGRAQFSAPLVLQNLLPMVRACLYKRG
jgi:hypothetical protein